MTCTSPRALTTCRTIVFKWDLLWANAMETPRGRLFEGIWNSRSQAVQPTLQPRAVETSLDSALANRKCAVLAAPLNGKMRALQRQADIELDIRIG